MHGSIPQAQRLRAARVKRAAVIAALTILAIVAMIGAYDLANSTEQGHKLLIRLGFEYPSDCG
jgi:hypothetical protein